MSDWASRRKSIYLGVVILILASVGFAIFWKFWYQVPTCFDKTKNGDELGIDCGGSCTLVCSADVIKPIVKWGPRLFEISPGVWSTLVYVENPNINVDANYVPYTFTVYDENNKVLEKREGATILPKNKTVGIFEGNILNKGTSKPKRAIFELGTNIIWNKNKETGEKISVTNSPILKIESSPRVEASVKNNSTGEIKNIELIAVIFDGADNAIAASRTFVETLPKDKEASVFFTWPKPFELGSRVCEKNSDVMLLLDRSGSMSSLGLNPPEPLTSAKGAATTFVDQLKLKDKIGMVSFANTVKDPIDLNLTSDFNLAKQSVGSVAIIASSTQYTNIYEALRAGWQELISARADDKSSKIMVLLTDGVATNPKNPKSGTEAEDIKYAEDLALSESLNIKKDGISIYTIGLGKEINEAFLKSIASSPDNYFFAPSALNLETIYKNISSDICKEMPARIEITYKIFDTLF
ncbi:MAG: vWA domain-containing protein [Candidatus Paceibacterota bacterium]|jgi:Mg-chelatase subunit ChlD